MEWIYNDESYDLGPGCIDVYDAAGNELSYDFTTAWWQQQSPHLRREIGEAPNHWATTHDAVYDRRTELPILAPAGAATFAWEAEAEVPVYTFLFPVNQAFHRKYHPLYILADPQPDRVEPSVEP